MKKVWKKLNIYKKALFIAIILLGAFFVVKYITYSPIVEKSTAFTDTNTNDTTDKIQESNLNNNVEPTSDISSFIPKGWKILKQGDELSIAEGDLNKDGIIDKAFVIEEDKNDSSDSAAQRNLIIVFGNTDNSYDLSITSKNAILRADEGGTFGDPFESISIERGSVLLKFMGGSVRWDKRFRFRYQDSGWYLIGFTESSYELVGDSMERLQDDYNLITGDYIGERAEDGKIKTIEKNIGKKSLLNLNDFIASEYSIQS